MLKKTPLYELHLNAKAKIVEFANYYMPLQYVSILDEARHVRNSCGIFDVSHMGQILLEGKDTALQINKLLSNDFERVLVGGAQYNLLCNENGGVIDDLIAYRKSETEVLLCVNAANRELDFEWIKSHIGNNVTVKDISDETALIAIQGPKSEFFLKRFCEPKVIENLCYFHAVDTKIIDIPCYISRTGYTGEDGFEIYLGNDFAKKVWEMLSGIKEISPIGLGARDILRLEMCYPLHGHELSQTISPFEANLHWVIKLNKKCSFIGQNALLKLQKEIKRKLLAFESENRRIPRNGYDIITKDMATVGVITSGAFSPNLNKPIALGFVDVHKTSEKLFVKNRSEIIPLIQRGQPFINPKTVKK